MFSSQINSGGLEEFIGSSYVIISTFVIVVGELFAIWWEIKAKII